jgi:hypothetical protein
LIIRSFSVRIARVSPIRLPGPAASALVVATLLASSPALSATPAAPVHDGAVVRLYRDGVLPSGKPLRGEREAGIGVEGEAAACATCHRRSGLGSWEGQSVIPPIIGRYLFRPGARNVEDPDLPHVQGFVPHRDPYTEATLARAIRDGVDQTGRKLSYLMPRYKLDDATMKLVIGYLEGLTAGPVPGVSKNVLQFATIVTPDADRRARQGMLDVLRQFFSDKNGGFRGEAPPLQSTRGVMYRVQRKWELHVWELSGPPDTWTKQLEERLKAEPVFAVISGVGGRTWAPIHRFCEESALPCLLPNVELPVVAERDFYPVYFSRGVLLESQLVAHTLLDRSKGPAPHKVVQIYRAGDVGEDAARELASLLATARLEVVGRALGAGDVQSELASAVAAAGAADALVLWLRGDDLKALPAPPAASPAVFLSGVMGGLENAPLPAAWRASAHMAYPVDLPEARQVRMGFPHGWFKVRHLNVISERVQVDTYLACVILSETLGHMLDSFVRDYLIERMEMLLSHRLVNGFYPRLSLAPGQRFASKGGYLVHFLGTVGTRVQADGPWLVP